MSWQSTQGARNGVPEGTEAGIALPIFGRLLAQPASLSFGMIGLSVVLLQIPLTWYGRIWAVGQVSFGASEILLLCVLYAVLLGAWWLASIVAHPGDRRRAPTIVVDRSSYTWLVVVTAAGALGVIATIVLLISRLGVSGVVEAFASSRANELKFALYDDYAIGLSSLRYCPIIAAPAAALLVVRLNVRGPSTWLLLAVAMSSLLINSVISHRLSIVAAIVVYCVLHFRSGGRVSWRILAIGGSVLTAVLAVLNSSRNANFYNGIGIDNPLFAALAEAITYVATPAQGALAAMASLLTGDFNLPTGISSELTTNSSLLEVVRQFGYSGLLFALVMTSFWAFVYVRAYFSTRLEYICGAGVIGYAFAEFWRVFLFQYGIFFVLVTFTLLAGGAVRLGLNSLLAANQRAPDRG